MYRTFFCFRYRLSAIAVDPKVKTITGDKMDILFLGTGKFRAVVCVFIIRGCFFSSPTVMTSCSLFALIKLDSSTVSSDGK